MATRKYAKAFKFLTKRLRESTNDRKARLGITFEYDLRPHILYMCDGHFRYFLNSYGNVICGNEIIDSRIKSSSCTHIYSVGHLMKSFTKEDFIKMWLDNAINNTLYVKRDSSIDNAVKLIDGKLLDGNDTVESLCVQYDMAQV